MNFFFSHKTKSGKYKKSLQDAEKTHAGYKKFYKTYPIFQFWTFQKCPFFIFAK